MNSENIRELIPLYIENELEPDEIKLVKEHLEKDPALKAYAEELQKMWQLLDKVETIKPSPAYVSEFWTKLSKEKTWGEKMSEAISVKLIPKKWVPVLSALCVVLLITAYFQNYPVHQSTLPSAEIAGLIEDDLEFFENYELAENLEVIEDIELLEDMELLEQWEELEISNAA